MSSSSVFEQYKRKNYPHRFAATIRLDSIAGGVPLNPAVLEGHLKRKIAAPDDLIRAEVASIMIDRGSTAEEAVEEAARMKGFVGFTSDPEKGYWIAGANLKACIVEAGCIAAAAERVGYQNWGRTNKGIQGWLKEHVFVEEDRLYLGVHEPNEVKQSFIHKKTAKGLISAIQYTELVYGAEISFTIESDWDGKEADWAAIWLTAEQNGLGASRSRGYGTFKVIKWEPLAALKSVPKKPSARKAA